MQTSKIPKFILSSLKWVRSHRTISFAVAAVLVLLLAGSVGALLLNKKPSTTQQRPSPQVAKKVVEPPKKYYSPLTGIEVPNEAATHQPTTAIMIENSLQARPQSGLKAAGVVFEAIAEGGITRFLALYQQEKPQLIGPVRSIRLYDVEWLAPFQPSVAHVGGSLQALQEVRNGKYRDIDQFFNPGTYRRTTDRYAPHNVYTSFEKLDALSTAKGYTSSAVAGFTRSDGVPSKTPNATKFTVVISSAPFNSSYTYDTATNTYLRSQAGAPHTDREAGQIAPSSVVIMNVDEQTVLQDGYREHITTVGSGKVTVFQNGIVTEGTWTKSSVNAQIVFTGPDKKELPLNRGQTWITAIPNGKGSVTWQ